MQKAELRDGTGSCTGDNEVGGGIGCCHILETADKIKTIIATVSEDAERIKQLEEKGAVYYESGTKAKQYFPKITKEEAEQTEIRSLLDKVFHGNAGILVNTMVKNEMLQEEEITQLYNLLHGGNNDKNNGFS